MKPLRLVFMGWAGCLALLPPTLFASGIIPPDSPLIQYTGRVIENKTRGAIFDWPGVSFQVDIKETEVGFLLDGARNNLWVKVDGKPVTTWVCGPALAPYWVRNLSPGWHRLEIIKRTEGLFGPVLFKGMILGPRGEARTPPSAPTRRIEFLGDSWICGYGDEATTLHCKDLRPFENADLAFGAQAARELNAEAHLTAFSGRGVVRNYGDPSTASKEPFDALWARTLVESTDCPWDFHRWIPDAVVIHLGLNDFSSPPRADPQFFMDRYRQLLQQVRAAYPQAWIFCFTTTGWPYFSPLVRETVDSANRWGDKKVLFVGYASVPLSELGCDYHPLAVAHRHLADLLVPVIRKYLGWN